MPFVSLAESLGLVDLYADREPLTKDVEPTPLNASDIVNSPDYRASILRRIRNDDLPPAVECRLLDHALGKPIDRVETKDTTEVADLGNMSISELKLYIRQLTDLAERMTDDVVDSSSTPVDDPPSASSVH